MINMTIVTDSQGKLVGAVTGHTLASRHGELQAQVSFPQSYRLYKVEVADDMDMTKTTDAAAFEERLLKYVPKS